MATTTVTGLLRDINGAALPNAYVRFLLKNAGTDDTANAVHPRESYVSQTSATGQISETIWVNGDSGIGSVYSITLRYRDRTAETFDVIVPSSAGGNTIDLQTLLDDHQVTGSEQQASVLSQALNRANHTGGPDDLNGNRIVLDEDADTWVQASSDDTIIITTGGTTAGTWTNASFTVDRALVANSTVTLNSGLTVSSGNSGFQVISATNANFSGFITVGSGDSTFSDNVDFFGEVSLEGHSTVFSQSWRSERVDQDQLNISSDVRVVFSKQSQVALPDAPKDNHVITIINSTVTGETTISPFGSETIDGGQSSITLRLPGEAVSLIYDSTETDWRIF